MRTSASVFVVLIWAVVMPGCAGQPEQLGESALARQRAASSEIQTALATFIAQANRGAAETDDVVYISEGTFDRIAFYVPPSTRPPTSSALSQAGRIRSISGARILRACRRAQPGTRSGRKA